MAGFAGVYMAIGAMLMPVLVCAGVGAEWGRRKLAYPSAAIAMLVTGVASPALVFHTLSTTALSNDILARIAIAASLGIVTAALMAALILKLLRLPIRQLVPTSAFPNSGNLGLPLSHMAFGDTGLSVAVTFFAVCSFLQHTLGVRILTGGQGKSSASSWLSPVMIAAVAAVAIRAAGQTPPAWVLESTHLLGSLSVPLMLISLGHTLVTISHGSMRIGSCIGMIRLVVGVAAGALVVHLLDLPREIAGVTLLQMMMPVAVVNYMYAQRFTDHAETAASAVLSSTILFLLLSPLVLWYVGARI